MDVVPLEDLASCRVAALTVGTFDGVHLGHQRLLAETVRRAREAGGRSAVLAFDRHPVSVLRPEETPPALTDPEQKLDLLARSGIDLAVVLPVGEVCLESGDEFAGLLARRLGARVVVVSDDFRFGRRRHGDVAQLEDLGARHGFSVVALARPGVGGAPVTAYRVRSLLADGNVAGAAELLGRHFEVRGTVVHGDGRGAVELGYPTANLDLADSVCLPAVGIYAGWYRRPDASVYRAAISLGHRPTFYREESGRPLLEAFLLDADLDLYGERAAVSFVAMLRDERRFDSVADLVDQMRADVSFTRDLLRP